MIEKTYVCVLDQDEYKKYLYWKEMEEQGKLMILPCKPGDTVYAFRKGKIVEMIVTSVNVMEKSVLFLWKTKEEFALSPWLGGFTEKDIGVKVFMTEPEALEALKEMKK